MKQNRNQKKVREKRFLHIHNSIIAEQEYFIVRTYIGSSID